MADLDLAFYAILRNVCILQVVILFYFENNLRLHFTAIQMPVPADNPVRLHIADVTGRVCLGARVSLPVGEIRNEKPCL